MTEKRSPLHTPLSRRQFLRFAGMAAGATLLAACSPATPDTTDPVDDPVDQPEAPVASEQVTISWWNAFSTPTCQEVFPQVIEAFETKYPNIKVEFEISGGPPGGGEYTEVLLARIAAGNPPETATIWSPPSQYGARGALTAMDAMMEGAELARPDQFYESVMKSCEWQGKTYGLPASAGAGCIFYNTTAFEERGISTKREDFPTTWREIKELSDELTVWEGDELKTAGLVPWTSGWLNPVWAQLNGGQFFDSGELKYKIDSDVNIEWLEYWLSYLDDQYQGDVERFNLFGQFGDVYPESAFAMGINTIDQSGSWACTDVELPFEWEIAKLPVGPNGTVSKTGYWPNWFVMPKGCPHPEEAFLLCEHFCTEGWVIWYKHVMDTPAWRGFPDGVITEKLSQVVGEVRAHDMHEFFAEYLNDAAEMWTSPIEDFANDTFASSVDEIMHKAKTPAVALAEAQALCQSRLDETLRQL